MRNRAIWLAVIVIASCKRDHPCEKLADLVENCIPAMPRRTISDVELMCRSERGSGADAFSECPAAKTCDELKACLLKWDCNFVVNGADDQTPQLMCALARP